jgi:hypothetical protein
VVNNGKVMRTAFFPIWLPSTQKNSRGLFGRFRLSFRRLGQETTASHREMSYRNMGTDWTKSASKYGIRKQERGYFPVRKCLSRAFFPPDIRK